MRILKAEKQDWTEARKREAGMYKYFVHINYFDEINREHQMVTGAALGKDFVEKHAANEITNQLMEWAAFTVNEVLVRTKNLDGLVRADKPIPIGRIIIKNMVRYN